MLYISNSGGGGGGGSSGSGSGGGEFEHNVKHLRTLRKLIYRRS
jgi:hypothetical protein